MADELTTGQAIRQLAENGDEVYAKIGIAQEVNEAERVCDVEPLDGSAPILDVRFQADTEGDGEVKIPKIGSPVLVGFIDKETAVIINWSDLDRYNLKIESTEFEIDKDGFRLKRENENLKEVMEDLLKEVGKLCDEVNKIVVSVGTTPNVPVINQIKNRITVTIKNRFNTILK